LSWMAWSATARGDDVDDSLERSVQQALMEFYERHLRDTASTSVSLFPIQDEG
jgi:hypothetical protein